MVPPLQGQSPQSQCERVHAHRGSHSPAWRQAQGKSQSLECRRWRVKALAFTVPLGVITQSYGWQAVGTGGDGARALPGKSAALGNGPPLLDHTFGDHWCSPRREEGLGNSCCLLQAKKKVTTTMAPICSFPFMVGTLWWALPSLSHSCKVGAILPASHRRKEHRMTD